MAASQSFHCKVCSQRVRVQPDLTLAKHAATERNRPYGKLKKIRGKTCDGSGATVAIAMIEQGRDSVYAKMFEIEDLERTLVDLRVKLNAETVGLRKLEERARSRGIEVPPTRTAKQVDEARAEHHDWMRKNGSYVRTSPPASDETKKT
jgi:hypothetical protein